MMSRAARCVTLLLLSILITSQAHAGGKKLTVTSDSFAQKGSIPAQFTCEDADVSPALAWSSVPKTTKSIAVTLSDPDAPGGTFYHWGRYNISAKARSLAVNAPKAGAKEARNDFDQQKYNGPCPPGGETHRYIFTVYALNKKISASTVKKLYTDLKQGALKSAVVASGSITGTFQRPLSEEEQCYENGGSWACQIVGGVETNCHCEP